MGKWFDWLIWHVVNPRNVEFNKLYKKDNIRDNKAVNNELLKCQYMNYRHALLMYNLIRKCSPDEEFMQLNFQANLNPRIKHQNFFQIQNYNVGHNILINRLASLNDKIEQSWLSLSYSTFKIKCKSLFLTI